MKNLNITSFEKIVEDLKLTDDVRIVSDKPCMENLCKRIMFVAQMRLPLLISGENGTGKKTWANLVHHAAFGIDNQSHQTIDCLSTRDDKIINLLESPNTNSESIILQDIHFLKIETIRFICSFVMRTTGEGIRLICTADADYLMEKYEISVEACFPTTVEIPPLKDRLPSFEEFRKIWNWVIDRYFSNDSIKCAPEKFDGEKAYPVSELRKEVKELDPDSLTKEERRSCMHDPSLNLLNWKPVFEEYANNAYPYPTDFPRSIASQVLCQITYDNTINVNKWRDVNNSFSGSNYFGLQNTILEFIIDYCSRYPDFFRKDEPK